MAETEAINQDEIIHRVRTNHPLILARMFIIINKRKSLIKPVEIVVDIFPINKLVQRKIKIVKLVENVDILHAYVVRIHQNRNL